MSSNNKKSGNKVSFDNVLEEFNSENYSFANELLKKAHVAMDEAGLAKQLKVEITNQQAIELIKEYRFNEAITKLESNFQIQAKQGFPLAIDKSNLIIGLSCLYLKNYTKTIQLLSSTINSEKILQLYFYCILARLYNKEFVIYKTVSEFNNLFKDYIVKISPNRAKYLEAIFYLIKSDYKNYKLKIKELQPENQIQENNILFFQNYFTSQKNKKPLKEIKPLYKFLAYYELSHFEKEYLKNFDISKTLIIKNQTEIESKEIKSELENLCIYGKPLSNINFQKCLKNKEFVDVMPHIVYNQVNALYEITKEGINIDFDQRLASKIITENKRAFFQIPESIYLYLKYSQITDIVPENLFTNVNIYFEIHKNNLNDFQIESIFIMVHYLTLSKLKFSEKVYNEMLNLLKYKNDAAAIQMYKFENYCFNPKCKDFKDLINLFKSPFFNEFSKEFINRLTNILFDFNRSYNSFFESTVKKNYYLEIINKFLNVLSFDFLLHRKAHELLNFYYLFNKCLIDVIEEDKKNISSKVLEKYFNSYLQKIIYFKENNINSKYFIDYNKLLYFNDFEKLSDLFQSDKFSALKHEFLNYFTNDNELIVEIFITNEYNTSEPKYFAELLNTYLTSTVDFYNQTNKEKISKIYNNFFHLKNEPYDLDNKTYISIILSDLIKNYNKPNYFELIYYIFEKSIKLINLSQLNPRNFTTFYSFILYLIANYKPDFAYNYDFISECIDYIRKKNNPKALNLYNSAIERFKLKKDFEGLKNKVKSKQNIEPKSKQSKYENYKQTTLFD